MFIVNPSPRTYDAMFLDLYCLQGGFGVMFTVLLLAFTKNYGQSGPPMPYVLSALVDVARTSLYGAHASWSLHGEKHPPRTSGAVSHLLSAGRS